jgi:hypothetical protein
VQTGITVPNGVPTSLFTTGEALAGHADAERAEHPFLMNVLLSLMFSARKL